MSELRDSQLQAAQSKRFDVLVVGAGINGAVSAAALARHGVKTALIDQRDFAGFTSQQSSSLVWGGIKYLENMEFGLVRQLCASRNELMRAYPSMIQEIRFLTTLSRGFRYPLALLWLGSWFYWLLGNGYTRVPRLLSRRRISEREPVVETRDSVGGIEYSDAYLLDNDARFVFTLVRDAMDSGCAAINYAEAQRFERGADGDWHVAVRDLEHGVVFPIRAKVLVNATGPFVDQVSQSVDGQSCQRLVFSKGIHLIVDRVTENRRVLAFFADDGRLFFAIPMEDRTCIGTTDTRVDSPDSGITDADREFVLANANKCLRLREPLTVRDIIAERCGIRALVGGGDADGRKAFRKMSRRHELQVDHSRRWINIIGGKLTDCLNVGQEICDSVAAMGVELTEPHSKWYGEPGPDERERFERLARDAGLGNRDGGEALRARLWRRYGRHAFGLLDMIADDPGKAEPIVEGSDLLRAEIQFIAEREMIVRLDDFLRRRTLLAQTRSWQALRDSRGLREACSLLFGDRAQHKFDDYFAKGQDNGMAKDPAVEIVSAVGRNG